MSLRALARFCYRRRRLVVGLWLAALIGVNVLASVTGTNFTTNFSAPNTESTRAADLLARQLQGAVGRRRAGRDAGHAVDAATPRSERRSRSSTAALGRRAARRRA